MKTYGSSMEVIIYLKNYIIVSFSKVKNLYGTVCHPIFSSWV